MELLVAFIDYTCGPVSSHGQVESVAFLLENQALIRQMPEQMLGPIRETMARESFC